MLAEHRSVVGDWRATAAAPQWCADHPQLARAAPDRCWNLRAGLGEPGWISPASQHRRPLLLVAASDCQSPRRHVDRPEKLTPHRPSAVQATTPQALNAPPQSDVIADRRNWRAFDQRVSIRHVADFNGNACLAGLQPGGEVKTCPRRAVIGRPRSFARSVS